MSNGLLHNIFYTKIKLKGDTLWKITIMNTEIMKNAFYANT